MGNMLYSVAAILLIPWAIGYLGFHVGGSIHILLIIAIIVVIARGFSGKKVI